MWFSEVVTAQREVWVAQDPDDPALLGLLVLDRAWLDQLYVAPGRTGQGIGTLLLELAKSLRPDGFDLWCFVSNVGAQRFYRRHGLVEVERTSGHDNDERAPDIRFRWRPHGRGGRPPG